MSLRSCSAGIIAICLACVPSLRAADIKALEAAIAKMAGEIQGDVGIAIRHIETGEGFNINGDRPVPAASVYKLPIMVEAFRQIAEGRFSLQDRITVTRNMLHFSSVLSRYDPGLSPTIRDLIFLMITESENGATDILLEKVGAENVTQTMRKLGFRNIHVNRTVKLMMCDYTGIYDEALRKLSGEAFEKMYQSRPAATYYGRLWRERDLPLLDSIKKFNSELKDVASPNDITALMEAIFKGKVVSEQASRQMIDIMLQTRFAPDLIPALLPRGTPVARKAGTLPTSLNETGIIYLPENKGHLIVTVMHNNMRETRETAARFIAGVARAAYDHFVAVKQD